MRERHGELLPNGFHVGDLISYDRRSRVGFVTEELLRVRHPSEGVYATFDDDEEGARRRYEAGQMGSWLGTDRVRLVRNYLGEEPTQEGSSTMTTEIDEPVEVMFHGEPLRDSMRATEIVAGQEYRLIYPRDHHDMELLARATRSRSSLSQGTSLDFDVVSWPRPSAQGRRWNESGYPAGSGWHIVLELRPDDYSYVFIIPAGVTGFVAPTDEAYDGTAGEFVSHDGQIPEPGTIVRGMMTDTRQIEGLFLRANPETGEAQVEAKRRRDKRADGTFTAWHGYTNAARRAVRIEGATVFKAGADAPKTLVRTSPIRNEEEQAAIAPGMILSARSEYGREVYRGEVLSVGRAGGVRLRATEKSGLPESGYSSADGSYAWETIPAQDVDVHCVWADGRTGYDSAGWLWERVGQPGVKRVDPAYDPNRKTPHTGMKIGDLVVGLMRENEYGRDTVGSWVKGTIFKWDTRYGRPIVKVTDPMESNKKVDQEVALIGDDVYPAMADPATVSPEEYKKTLRLYLIGRHKRGDFCRGGLNTMLAAHGIPLYETRRRAQMVVTVDYDPNTTDLHTVQRNLSSKLAGVQGLQFTERSGEDIELTVESDVTAG